MSLQAAVRDLSWYHTIDLPDGVSTQGWFDTREAIRRITSPSVTVDHGEGGGRDRR
jgi:hypothetical protein